MGRAAKQPGTYSLRSLLIAALVGPLVLVAASIGTLGFLQGRSAMRTAADALFDQVNQHVIDHLGALLVSAESINEVMAAAFASGSVGPEDTKPLQGQLLSLMRAHPAISSCYVGSAAGGLVDAGREGSGGPEYLIETPAFAAGRFVKRAVDARDARGKVLLDLRSFDARQRPWFLEARAAGRPVWTEVFSLFSGQDSAISAARPLYGPGGDFVGVASVDLFLSQIGAFLRTMETEGRGRSYILDGGGRLVASPAKERIFTGGTGTTLVRKPAEDSLDPLIAASARALAAAPAPGPDFKNLSFEYGGQRYIALVSPLPKPEGHGWRVVTAFPASTYMGRLDGNLAQTAGLALAIIALFAGLALLLAGLIAARAREFSAFAAVVAQGGWKAGDPAPRLTSILEVEAVRKDLIAMGAGLEEGFARLRTEIEERKRAEEGLRLSQHAFDRLARNLPLGVYVLRSRRGGSFCFDFTSSRFREIFGFEPGEPVTGPESYIPRILPEDLPSFLAEQEASVREGRVFTWEGRIRVGDRTLFVHKTSVPEVQSDGDTLWDGYLVDATATHEAEERIKSLLAEKELLLREVHHRIKNNMNSTAAMLLFQADSQDDGKTAAALRDASDRLGSMMILYDRLYRGGGSSSTDAAAFLEAIATQVASHHPHLGGVTLRAELESLDLDARLLSPLGIIANELVVNAYKHAFPEGRRGEILVALRHGEGRVTLLVQDDGVGSLGAGVKNGFGRTLVEGLAGQMGGEVRLGEAGGARAPGSRSPFPSPIDARPPVF